MFTAVLDTSVLWPSLQRDFLLSLAVENIYRPVWSSAILAELEYHEAAKLVRRGLGAHQAADRAKFLVEQMQRAFDDAEVSGWEPLEGSFGLPDPDDEHVVAAAVVAGAGAIVTSNLRHFPAGIVPSAIAVLPPQEFASGIVALAPTRALVAVDAIATRSGTARRPKRTIDDILEHLVDTYGMADAVDSIRAVRAEP